VLLIVCAADCAESVLIAGPSPALFYFRIAATAISRYSSDIASSSDGPLIIRTMIQWGRQSSSDAIKTAVALSFGALCRCSFSRLFLSVCVEMRLTMVQRDS
jgi:hypothetical protein